MFNPFSSPFEDLYERVTKRIHETPAELRRDLSFGVKYLKGKKVIVLHLDYLTPVDKSVINTVKTCVFHEPGYLYENWCIQLMSAEKNLFELIPRGDRYRIEDLLNGKEVPSGTDEYVLRLAQKRLNAAHN